MKNPEVNKNYKIEFPKLNKEKVKQILIDHDFSEERIDNQLAKLEELTEKKKQKTLF